MPPNGLHFATFVVSIIYRLLQLLRSKPPIPLGVQCTRITLRKYTNVDIQRVAHRCYTRHASLRLREIYVSNCFRCQCLSIADVGCRVGPAILGAMRLIARHSAAALRVHEKGDNKTVKTCACQLCCFWFRILAETYPRLQRK
jgi:hypothetical protein